MKPKLIWQGATNLPRQSLYSGRYLLKIRSKPYDMPDAKISITIKKKIKSIVSQ
jgi:hypothetical protein